MDVALLVSGRISHSQVDVDGAQLEAKDKLGP